MTIFSRSFSLKTYALAFAVVLSPAMMQVSTCYPAIGDATLSALEVEVMGENQIASFDSGQRNYDLWLPPNTDTTIVRAYSTDPNSQVSYNFSKIITSAGTLETIDYGYFPNGGGEITLNGLLPEGHSALGIHVRAPGGARAVYTVAIQVGGCSDSDECDDRNECTDDVCNPDNGNCGHTAVPDGAQCLGGRCYSGLCDFVPVSVAIGPKEVVFDWTTDRCDDLDLPDGPARAVRTADGEIVLFAGVATTYRVSRGPDFDTLQRVCDPPALVSADLQTPESYENQEWIWAVYREGASIHALIHNEFHDAVAPTCKVGDPSSANPCWYNSVTYAVSTDGGYSFSKPGAPAHVVAPAPEVWTPPPEPQPHGFHSLIGYHGPSNIVRGADDYYYAYILLTPSQYSPFTVICLMRTDALDDPASWRAWDGTGFNHQMESPYVTGNPVPLCTAGAFPGAASLTYNTYLGRYMLVDNGGNAAADNCGIYLSLSPDLIHWGQRQLVARARWHGCQEVSQTPLEPGFAQYTAIIDHADSTTNFERPGRDVYLYYTRFNEGHWLDRDLVRVPIRFTMGGPLCEGVDCDDQNACTDDTCNGADGSCEHTPIDCADSNDCTVDTCDPTVGCEYDVAANGTACAGGSGTCQDGSCAVTFPCTEQGIRDAIAAGGGPHTFGCATPTTVVTADEIVIDNDVALDGGGQLTVDGNQSHRVFSVNAGTTAELIGFTVTGGAVGIDLGGGVVNNGTLTLTSTTVSGNQSGGGGGGAFNGGTMKLNSATVANNNADSGGGIMNWGTLIVTDTTVTGNTSVSEAGGLSNYPDATATLTRTTLQGNNATSGSGGGIANNGTISLTDATIYSNSAGGDGGGILNAGTMAITRSTIAENVGAHSGGGIENYSGSIEIDSSTVSGNSALAGGGGAIENPFPAGTLSLTNTTVSGNSSINRGAIENVGAAVVISSMLSLNVPDGTFLWDGTGRVTIRNTILDGTCKVLPVVDSLGGNVESEGNTCGLDHSSDQVYVPAPLLLLGPLQDNGGPTMTHALLPGSVAIDWIPEADCVDADGLPLATDQRGEPRPGGTMCDVGAFEVQP